MSRDFGMVEPFTIEPGTPEALSAILKIEEACFSAPWTRKMLEAELTGNQFAHFLLAKSVDQGGTGSEAFVGYLCFWIVFEEVRLMNLAVMESMRRRGIARALVTEALHAGLAQSAIRALLEVRASNQAAQSLYAGLGFRHVSSRPKYYTNPIEDAVLMELEPIVSGPPPVSRAIDRNGGQVRPH